MRRQARPRRVGVVLLVVSALASGCQTVAFNVRPNLPTDPDERRIVVLRPDVELSVLHAGGRNEPNAEWTRLAKQHIARTLDERFASMNVRLVRQNGDALAAGFDSREVQLLKLHGAVAHAIAAHQFGNSPWQLPTKAEEFDWSMGPGTAYLEEKYGADYALFMYVRDSYSSSGRVAAMILAAALGVGIQGGVQVGYCSLIDLSTGQVVWFNRLARATGDLRTAEGARETVGVLLQDFPQ